MALGTISAALFVVKLLESEDGSTTPLILAIVGALVFGGMSNATPLDRAGHALNAIAAKIDSQPRSFK